MPPESLVDNQYFPWYHRVMYNLKFHCYTGSGGGSGGASGGGSNGCLNIRQSKPKETGMRYARIYRRKDGNMNNEEPVGRAYYNGAEQHWIKFDDGWHGPGEYNFLEINKAEYETDQAFELFPILKVIYRPIRMWLKLHQRLMHLLMLVSSFLTLNLAMNVPNFVPVEYNLFVIAPLGLLCIFSVIWQIGKWEKWKWWTNWFDIPVTFE